ncbi:YncE family protein [Salegentibacter sp.]|uniref:YncE family protein n=1 Tax=Salegentibacter sp. TaxID=1903072 RepID=UPI0035626DFF
MKIRFFMAAVLSAVLFASCESDNEINEIPEEELGNYSEGVFVLNEGNFGSGNSSVSYLDPDLEEIQNNIYAEENNGESPGDTGQSIGFYGDYAFIVMNVSGKIQVVDRHTFENITTIESGLDNPRFIDFSNEKAFVTNWGDGTDPDDDFVAVYDLGNFELEETIPVEEGPEKILTVNDKIYVAHKGGFGFNNTISVLDPNINIIEKTIEVGDVPNSMVSNGNSLWVLSSGLPSYAENETAGKITEIDLTIQEVVQEFEFNEKEHPGNLNLDEQVLYYTLDDTVYTLGQGEESLPDSGITNFSDEGILYGFEVAEGKIYASFVNYDFTGNGKLIIKDNTGNLIDEFDTGINPNGIYIVE